MAIINPIWGEMRGSLGGITFSRNKGGNYARLRAKPTDPSSAAQMNMRTAMNNVSRVWSQFLTEEQRNAWNEYAALNPVPSRLGGWLTLSGHQFFCGLNSRLVMVGSAMQLVPPTTNAPSAVSITATGDEISQQLTIDFAPAPLPSGHRLICWWTGWRRPGTNPNLRQARILGWSPLAQASPWTVDVPTPTNDETTTNLYVCVMNANGQISAFSKAEGLKLT